MNRVYQKASPYCRRCAEVGREAICHQFAAVALKAGVDLEGVSNGALLLEIKPQDRHGKHWFFISEHAKIRNGAVVREFATREDYSQGQVYDGDNYCRGPHKSKETLLSYSVEHRGNVYVCLWLSHNVERLLESADRVTIRSLMPVRKRLQVGPKYLNASVEAVS
ncbi:MAG: hypothetical protein F4058_03540 [Rhodothermaceae bacterium]|nr:hypothetical protein [Rhodothermaceae bacterium]MYI84390.1 hypothetical protein [Rhodothermaceae bacterium]